MTFPSSATETPPSTCASASPHFTSQTAFDLGKAAKLEPKVSSRHLSRQRRKNLPRPGDRYSPRKKANSYQHLATNDWEYLIRPLFHLTIGLRSAVHSMAEALQSAGYRTAHVGKWHLGDAAYYPETHGFEFNIGGTMWGAPNTFFHPFDGSGTWGDEFPYVAGLGLGTPDAY